MTLLSLALVGWTDPLVDQLWESKLRNEHIEVFRSAGKSDQTAYKFVGQLEAAQDAIINYLFYI